MVSFYPGPSQIYPQVSSYLADAFESGILSANHRSAQCMALVEETLALFHEKLNLPADYSIYFTSSATECWEIISHSIISPRNIHIFNGAFGKKWSEYDRKIVKSEIVNFQFGENQKLPFFQKNENDLICITQNETSNGTQISIDSISQLKDNNCLIAVDATSSMAGIELDWSKADIWLASVQKCFGLPAGLGVLVCSPMAIQACKLAAQQNHYNSLLNIDKNMQLFQTAYTPNVLGIYLLNRVLNQIENIAITSQRIKKQAKEWYEYFEKNSNYTTLIDNKECRSDTVIVLKGEPEKIAQIKQKAAQAGIVLGNGYGEFKDNTFRIANFPAINPSEIAKLKDILR
jgi:phosphoserine aminotransferase